MAIYSISDLEKISGIKSHTIRIWEKRYGLLEPKRTKTNIRYYIDDDLQKLLNVALLIRNGYKISKIASMNPFEMNEAVVEISSSNNGNEHVMSDALTLSMIEMDEEKFNTVFDRNKELIGLKRTITEVLIPFVNRVSVLWITGAIKPVQENFIVNLVKQKLYAGIDRLPVNHEKEKIIIYLPENEKEELSLLFVHFILRSLGFYVINLGVNTNMGDLLKAYSIHCPAFLFTLINENISGSGKKYISDLSQQFGDTKILLTGYQNFDHNQFPNIIYCKELKEIIQFLSQDNPVNSPSEVN